MVTGVLPGEISSMQQLLSPTLGHTEIQATLDLPHVQKIPSAERLELKPLSHSNAAELEQKLALIPKRSGRCLGSFSPSRALLQAHVSFVVVTSPHTGIEWEYGFRPRGFISLI